MIRNTTRIQKLCWVIFIIYIVGLFYFTFFAEALGRGGMEAGSGAARFNLIPFNPFPDSDLKKPDPKDVKAFQDYLIGQGIVTTVRKTRGDDIDAACGQLAGNIKDKTRRAERLVIQKAQATFLTKES